MAQRRNGIRFFTLISWWALRVKSCSADCQETLMTNVMRARCAEARDYRYGIPGGFAPGVRGVTAVRGG